VILAPCSIFCRCDEALGPYLRDCLYNVEL
jgi:hypothetical protein